MRQRPNLGIEYVIHLPEASAPVVMFLGVVVEQEGKLNEVPTYFTIFYE